MTMENDRYIMTITTTCPFCGGSGIRGILWPRRCKRCNGTGRYERRHRITRTQIDSDGVDIWGLPEPDGKEGA